MPFQRRIIPGLLKLAKEFDLKPGCSNDVHYVMKEDFAPHDALLCIQTGRIIDDEDRMKYPPEVFYLKSHSEMSQIFGEIPELLSNTLEVAEKVDLEIRFGENHYPRFERPMEVKVIPDRDNFQRILDIYEREQNKVNIQNGQDSIKLTEEQRDDFEKNGAYLFQLCKEGLKERYGVDYSGSEKSEREQSLCDQLDYELAIITGAGFVDYFLIVWDFIRWARQQKIPVGPGRGSGAGCIVAYVLKITDVDPTRFGLLFERMLSLERVSPPDFDIDFCMRRRDEVVGYVRDKYGADQVANIITYGTFGAKMIVRDLARVHDVPYSEADRLAKMVPDDLNISLEQSLERSSELANEEKTNPVARVIIEQGKVIEGMVRNTGKHACVIIIGEQILTNLIPLRLQEGDLTTQYAKGPVEDLGLLKMDFLGLKTLTVISDAQENVRRTTNQPGFDIEKVPLDDAKTFDLLNSGRTTGVFQLESSGMQSLCRQIGLSSFEEIIALIALYRPGPMQFIPQYIEGKRDPYKVKMPHPLLEDVVKETYGVMVYQEQVMEAARIIAGYTLGEADILRRAMGKKIRAVMEAQKEVFIKGAERTNGLNKRDAEEIFGILEKFAQYGFNKSHSAAYAMLSYRTAYLKANYPVQFMAALLSCELGNADKVSHFIEECAAMELPVAGPDVNQSRENFTPVVESGDTATILFGLGAIKGVGDGAAQHIIAEREASGPFSGFHDFATRLDGKVANKRVMEALIKTGAFDALGEERGYLLYHLESTLKEVADLQRDRARGQGSLFDLMEEPPPAAFGKNGNGHHESVPEMPLQEKLQYEKELLGFYLSGHPMNAYREIAEQIDTFQGKDYTQLDDRTPFRLCGVVTGLTKKLARKDNRPWAVIQLSTRLHSYTLHLYADAFERVMGPYQRKFARYKEAQSQEDADPNAPAPIDPLAAGSLLVLEGSVSQRNGESLLVASQAWPLSESLPGLIDRLCWVLKPEDTAVDFFRQLREEVQVAGNSGETEIKIGILSGEEDLAVADIAQSLTWRFDETAFKRLYGHPAVVDCLVHAKAPEREVPRWERKQF